MNANELIVKAREEAGLTQADVARKCGLTVHEYSDVEQHSDEITDNVSLAKLRGICAVLRLDLAKVIAGTNLDILASRVNSPGDVGVPRHLLIKGYREQRNASVSDVANAIGYEEEAVRRGESDENFLETLPICVLNDWSKYVGLPLNRLVGT